MGKTLIDILEEQGLKLNKSSGGRFTARCPFHDGDNEPSFTIYPNESYYCFGCEVWGDAVKFLVDYKGMAPRDALEYVGEDYRDIKKSPATVIKLKNAYKSWRFVGECIQKYHDFLKEVPGTINYLQSRGLSEETIAKFKIGYTDGRVLNLQFEEEYKLALEVNLITQKGWETLSHRIIIPSLIEENACDFAVGRTVINDKIKYLGLRMPKPLMGFHEVRHSPIIFLVEGPFDWLILRQWGYPAVCLNGTHLTEHLSKLLYGKQIIIVPDIDEVGLSAANKLKNRFEGAEILDYSRFSNGVKLDISAFAEKSGAEEIFKELVLENFPWLITTSKGTLERYFPHLKDMTLYR